MSADCNAGGFDSRNRPPRPTTPAPVAPPLIPQQPTVPPVQQPSVKECECDEDSLAAAILAKLPKYPTADELGDAVANKLKGDTTFITAIAAQIKVDVPRPALERHIVIVANQKASYWPRLSDELNRVKDIYQGIEVADPPANYRGHLPQAILYESGKPRVLGVGQNQVSGVLQRLSRGDDF